MALFPELDSRPPGEPACQPLGPGAVRLAGLAEAAAPALWRDVQAVLAQAPLRHLVTPGGFVMSVAMSNCGALGWVSDAAGYRYTPTDPANGRPWPEMPASFIALAAEAAERAGFPGFEPDACLVNCYRPGARLTLHQDRNERDLRHPIVSVSLGLPAVFLFGGPRRSDKTMRIRLHHGDVVVWGGPARLHHHGVLALADGWHALTGACRFNLTLRRAA